MPIYNMTQEPLNQYSNIQPLVQKEIDDKISEYAINAKYSLAQIPAHNHDGVNSQKVDFSSLVSKNIYVTHTLIGTEAATAANYKTFFIAPVACRVTEVSEVHTVAGTDGGNVKLGIDKLTGTQAPGGGSSILSGGDVINLKGTIEKFNLTSLEKFKIQQLLEESGQKIVNAVVKFVDPKFKRYALNIYLMTWKGNNKDSIRDDIISAVSDYLISFRRKDYLPKSDLIGIVRDVVGVDSVAMYFVSEDIENEMAILLDSQQIANTSLPLSNDEITNYMSLWESDEYKDNIDMKLAVLFANQKVKDFITLHLDENGDVVLNKNERILIRGGWSDRGGNFYSDLLQKDKLSAINVNFIGDNDKSDSQSFVKYSQNQLKI